MPGRLALVHANGVRIVTLGEPPAVDRRASGTWLGLADDDVRMNELTEETGRMIVVRGGRIARELAVGPLAGFTASAAGRWLATATHDAIVTVRAADDLAVRCTLRTIDRATALALTPDGALLFAGGWDATVHAFRLP